jgi:hypothetical protein
MKIVGVSVGCLLGVRCSRGRFGGGLDQIIERNSFFFFFFFFFLKMEKMENKAYLIIPGRAFFSPIHNKLGRERALELGNGWNFL